MNGTFLQRFRRIEDLSGQITCLNFLKFKIAI